MTKTEHIRDMLTIAARINRIVSEMKSRKDLYLADLSKKAA
ncbi:hypothetical protein ACOGYE_003547 [Edwardsiella piscicida]